LTIVNDSVQAGDDDCASTSSAMANVKSNPPAIPDRIDVESPSDVAWWCRKLKCTEEELRYVVKRYGTAAKDVEGFFAGCRR
jgi:Protein of unknown function (DUF3606)